MQLYTCNYILRHFIHSYRSLVWRQMSYPMMTLRTRKVQPTLYNYTRSSSLQVSTAHPSFPATQFVSYSVNNGYTLTNIWCMLVGSWEREKSPQAADHTSSCSAFTTEKSGSGDVSWGRRERGRKREKKGENSPSKEMETICGSPV